MANKNNKQENPDEKLEHQVDQMMDPKLPDPQPDTPAAAKGAPDVPDIDIFKDAPESSAEKSDASKDEQIAKAEPVESKTVEKESIPEDASIDNPSVDPLVDDIVSKESDQLLDAQDAEIAEAFAGRKLTPKEKIKDFFVRWWANKPARYGTIALLIFALVAIGVVPSSRYFVLNTAGVRAGASLKVLDSTTDLPLKNVDVTIGAHTGKSDKDGVVRLKDLRLGPQTLVVEQLGFAPVKRQVTLGLGSNPLGEFELTAVGAQYTIKVTDYVSGKPIARAEATSGESTAQSDNKGVITLTIGNIESPKIEVNLTASGKRPEVISFDATTKQPLGAVMVSKRKEIFVSKQSGKYDVYKIDIDGKNKQLLLAGTGNERDRISVVPHPSDEMVALVSSRDTKRNHEGYLLDTLTLIDTDDGSTVTLEHSENIRIFDWIKNKLIYVKVKAGASAFNAEREQLIAYDYSTSARLQLASANAISDVVSAKGAVYFIAANQTNYSQSQFQKVNPDNTGKQNLATGALWSIARVDYDNMYLSGNREWYSYRIGDSGTKKLSQTPANVNERKTYLDAPDGKNAVWADSRDGKGVLVHYDISTKKEKVLVTQNGLNYPLRWLDNRTVVYRLTNDQETASYVVSLDGGTPKKIIDVTYTAGLGERFY